jgi:hypothetical protein
MWLSGGATITHRRAAKSDLIVDDAEHTHLSGYRSWSRSLVNDDKLRC